MTEQNNGEGKKECPICGNTALRVDVGVIGLVANDWIHGIPQEAEDICVGAHGFNTLSPVGAITVAWHDRQIMPDDVQEHGAASRSFERWQESDD